MCCKTKYYSLEVKKTQSVQLTQRFVGFLISRRRRGFVISQETQSNRKRFRRLLNDEILDDVRQNLWLDHGLGRAPLFHFFGCNGNRQTVFRGHGVRELAWGSTGNGCTLDCVRYGLVYAIYQGFYFGLVGFFVFLLDKGC